MISSQQNSFILPSLLGSWFINLSYGEFSKIVPVIGYSSVYSVIHSWGYSCGSKSRAACRYKSRISERENWNTFYKGFFQLPAVRTVAVFSLLFVDTNSVMVQFKKNYTSYTLSKQRCGPALIQRSGFWRFTDLASRGASLLCPFWRKHQLCDEIERPLQLQHDKMCLFCTKVGQRTALKRRQREKGKTKRKWPISESKTNFLEVI